MEQSALIVFFKWAKSGGVKTRLTPPLSPKEAAKLYQAFVCDTFAKVRKLKQVSVFGFVAGKVGDGGELETLLQRMSIPLIEQVGRDLGERMRNAFLWVFEQGFSQAVIVGTDSPDLPLERIHTAFDTLTQSVPAVCLCPAEDGGYVLLGMNRYFPEVFENVPYSSNETYRATLRQVCQLSVQLFVFPRWYDVDTSSDLWRLAAHLDAKELPHTAAVLRELSLEKLAKHTEDPVCIAKSTNSRAWQSVSPSPQREGTA